MKRFFSFIGLCLFVFVVQAQSLYVEQFENAAVDDKTLQEARKQIEDHKVVEIKENIFVPPFHQQKPPQLTDKKEFCNDCHLSPPHKKDERKRGFLNMHSRYISCLSCHFQPQDVPLEYRWLSFDENENEDSIKRIAPFYDAQPVPVFSDNEFAVKIQQAWKKESPVQRAELKAKVHAPLGEQGPKCLACHDNKKQLLDLDALGYSEKEIKKLQRHAIPRFFSRFKKDEQRLRMTDLLK